MADKIAPGKKTCKRVLISGKVQGVGYRFSTLQFAQKLGVKGWVRNIPDSRVEALFCGEIAPVEAIIEWCHEGPPAAVVERVTVTEIVTEIPDNFEIR